MICQQRTINCQQVAVEFQFRIQIAGKAGENAVLRDGKAATTYKVDRTVFHNLFWLSEVSRLLKKFRCMNPRQSQIFWQQLPEFQAIIENN